MTACPYCAKDLAMRVPSRGAAGGYWHAGTRRVDCEQADLKAVIDGMREEVAWYKAVGDYRTRERDAVSAELHALNERLRWKTVAESPPVPNVVYQVIHTIHGNCARGLGVWLPTVELVPEGETSATQHPGGWDVEGVTHYREQDNTWPEAGC